MLQDRLKMSKLSAVLVEFVVRDWMLRNIFPPHYTQLGQATCTPGFTWGRSGRGE